MNTFSGNFPIQVPPYFCTTQPPWESFFRVVTAMAESSMDESREAEKETPAGTRVEANRRKMFQDGPRNDGRKSADYGATCIL